MALGDVVERAEAGEASKIFSSMVFRLPQPGIYEHYKMGRYRLLFLTERHTHNGDMDAVYVSLTTGKVCTRPVVLRLARRGRVVRHRHLERRGRDARRTGPSAAFPVRGSMMERWKVIPGVRGYEVSNLGQVRSWRVCGRSRTGYASSPRMLVLTPDKDGYRTVCLIRSPAGHRVYRKVHHLVLEAFRGPRPAGKEARHLNNHKADNALRNLRWATHAVNIRDQVKFGTQTTGSRNAMAKFTNAQAVEIRRRSKMERGRDLAREFSCSEATISRIKHGVRYAGAR